MGRALAAELSALGFDTTLGARGASGSAADVVLLAVPDAAIAEAAARIEPGRLVGHLSGATPLDPLAPHEAFGLHPLTSVAREGAAAGAVATAAGTTRLFAGVHAAVDGTSARALAVAEQLAHALGMLPFRLAAGDRAAYHAAASVASNFLVTLEAFAEQLAASAGVPREALAPIVRATVRNWEALGAPAALTGPVARGDEATIAAQRGAVAERAPERLDLFDALVAATRDLARKAAR